MVSTKTCSHCDCAKDVLARGLCKTHYSRWRRPRVVRPTVSERFWSRVTTEENGDCWPWPKVDPKGYGYFRSERGKESVHRFAYRDKIGPVPDGLQVDHMCRNRACVNPLHLQVVDGTRNSENVATTGRPGTSQYRGVDWHKRIGKWRARVQSNGKVIHLGFFDLEVDAANAALRKRLDLHSNNLEDRALEVSGIVK